MTKPFRACRVGALTALLLAVALVAPAVAQAPATWTAPRTAWGDPDLQGIWNSANTGTPMERPTEFGTREFLTEEEIAARVAALTESPPPPDPEDPEDADPRDAALAAGARPTEQGIFGQEYNRFWVVSDPRAVMPWNRTSLIIDPPGGRMPPLTLDAIDRLEARDAARAHRGEGDDWRDRNLGERCIAPGQQKFTTSTFEIFQSPGVAAIRIDAFNYNEPMVVPLDGRPRLGVRQWMGESRGRWEGETLVVETDNFIPRQDGGSVMPKRSPLLRYLGSGETLRVTQRFRRTGPVTLEYSYTVEDPGVRVAPYTVLHPMVLENDLLMVESACHEGNYGIVGQLSAARADEEYAMDAAREEAATRAVQYEEMRRHNAEWTRARGR